jgi:hypothetical protein
MKDAGSERSILNPKDGGDMSRRNIGFQRTTRCYNKEDNTLHNQPCQNLKSNIFNGVS